MLGVRHYQDQTLLCSADQMMPVCHTLQGEVCDIKEGN